MNIRELSRLTGVAERQVRYMIAEGFVPPPKGGRAHAQYDAGHVAAIRRYMALRGRGLPPQAIRVVLENGMAAPFPVAPGIALHVDPLLLGGPMDTAALADRLAALVNDLFEESTDAQDDAARPPPREPTAGD